MNNLTQKAYCAALAYYQACGVDEVLLEEPFDRFQVVEKHPVVQETVSFSARAAAVPAANPVAEKTILGAQQAIETANALVKECNSLEMLKESLEGFEGVAIRKTARQIVFSSGNPQANLMIIGDAPSADCERQGNVFSGAQGRLMDSMCSALGLSRTASDPSQGVYYTNLLPWRPPGNRSPTESEISVLLPFLRKHIALAAPKVLVVMGAVTAKALLERTEGVSRLRRKKFFYDISGGQNQSNRNEEDSNSIPLYITFHPAYLLETPIQKRCVWEDLIAVSEHLK